MNRVGDDMTQPEDLNIVFIGTGAIGGSAGAWVSERHNNTYLLGRGLTGEVMRTKGLALYPQGQPGRKEQVFAKVIRTLGEIPNADVVVIAVKLYDLESVAQSIQEELGDRALVVGLQNGVENQKILPRYFSRVVYGVVAYNAWVDEPGVIGYQQKGPIALGTPDNSLQDEIQALAAVFSLGFETVVTQHLQDLAHSKLVINLANSVTTLLGPDYRKVSDLDLYQAILSNTIYEGVRVMRAAGYHEEHLGGLPTWRTLWASAKLPQLITRGVFRRNLAKMTLSSMGQDIFKRKSSETELEYLNGYLLQLADQHQVDAPYNRTIYRLCKQHFSNPDFHPMDVWEVWKEIQKA